jgi:Abortive infection C-terminus
MDDLDEVVHSTPERALELLTLQAAELTAAAAPEKDHRPDNRGYVKRKRELDRTLATLGVTSPFPWPSLTTWVAVSKVDFPENYRGRRQHIKELGAPVREQLERRIADRAAGDLNATVRGLGTEASSALTDASAIRQELRRIEQLIDADPAAAIGKAKNLIEATAKAVLAERGVAIGRNDNVPTLVGKSMAELGLDTAQAGGHDQIVASTLLHLQELAGNVNRFRNKAGDGHGQVTAVQGLDLRHGRLAARSAIAWCAFVLETLHDMTPAS